MTLLSLIFIFAGRYYSHIRGSVLYMAAVVVFLKFSFSGGIAFYPILAIIFESMIIELTLWSSKPRRLSYILAGAISVGYTLFHPAVTHGLLAGKNVFIVYADIFYSVIRFFNTSVSWLIFGFAILLVVHLFAGAMAAWIILRTLDGFQKSGIVVNVQTVKNYEKK
ncbi:hypothetical protein JW935_11280 [candidate division KSB1 bacterium]|nr:hypothetical protein [candidate division KSB1 bacterium]